MLLQWTNILFFFITNKKLLIMKRFYGFWICCSRCSKVIWKINGIHSHLIDAKCQIYSTIVYETNDVWISWQFYSLQLKCGHHVILKIQLPSSKDPRSLGSRKTESWKWFALRSLTSSLESTFIWMHTKSLTFHLLWQHVKLIRFDKIWKSLDKNDCWWLNDNFANAELKLETRYLLLLDVVQAWNESLILIQKKMKVETIDKCNILLQYKKDNLIYLSLNFVFFHKDFYQSQSKHPEICIKFVFFSRFIFLFFHFGWT